ncbi:MAG: hypothetical protein EAX90_09260 [Candidatus Heimdallarchaeota archaeon]|nr:hypothetical protein [Candidatus Heimdallarchaeota archaeon]
MAVLESGVMYSGIPIVKVNYYNDQTTDSMLTAGLLEAIQLFAVEIFDDETETFKMKKYSIFLHNIILESKQKIILYSICDSLDRPRMIKNVMIEIGNKFKENYHSVDYGCLSKYSIFEDIITKNLGDLIYRPEDRLRKVFQ